MTDKGALADQLIDLLSDTFALYRNTHLAHWNVMGSSFPQLHELFGDQYEELFGAVDTIAEQLRAIGYLVPADFDEGKVSRFKATTDANSLLSGLLTGHEDCIKCAEDLATKAAEAKDEGTLNLAADRLNAHRKHAWMLRATIG